MYWNSHLLKEEMNTLSTTCTDTEYKMWLWHDINENCEQEDNYLLFSLIHLQACITFPCSEPYFGGLVAAYGQNAFVSPQIILFIAFYPMVTLSKCASFTLWQFSTFLGVYLAPAVAYIIL